MIHLSSVWVQSGSVAKNKYKAISVSLIFLLTLLKPPFFSYTLYNDLSFLTNRVCLSLCSVSKKSRNPASYKPPSGIPTKNLRPINQPTNQLSDKFFPLIHILLHKFSRKKEQTLRSLLLGGHLP